MVALLGGYLTLQLGIGRATGDLRLKEDTLASLVDGLDCRSSDYIADDLSFWDSVRGADCILDDGSALVIRVFAHEGSAEFAFVDWAPLLGADNQVMFGRNWFMLGRPSKLKEAASFVVDPGPISDSVDTSLRLPQRLLDRGTCSSLLGHQLQAIASPDQSNELTAEVLENLYPGSGDMLASLIKPEVSSHIIALSNYNDTRLLNYLATFGPELKQFCQTQDYGMVDDVF